MQGDVYILIPKQIPLLENPTCTETKQMHKIIKQNWRKSKHDTHEPLIMCADKN